MATGHGKVLQYTRHGLRMVGDSASLFDLNEPVWHPDEKVRETGQLSYHGLYVEARVYYIFLLSRALIVTNARINFLLLTDE